MRETVISYAQNGEDVVLARLFQDQLFGRYVDVGAAHPVRDSVRKHFYDLGWRGANVEGMRGQLDVAGSSAFVTAHVCRT